MERLITFLIAVTISLVGKSQRIDFGIEVSQNYNYVEKFKTQDLYNPSNLAVSIEDFEGDTLGVYFNRFSMDNHIEIPLYFRMNFRKRLFFDVKLSNSVNRLQMWGVSNYSQQYFTDKYGTYDDFITAAALNGFNNADRSDYDDYIQNARDLNEAKVRTTEEFKLLTFTINAGLRFFPHKSVKMFLAAGFTFKNKYNKHSYSNLSYSNDNLQNLFSLDKTIDKYAEKSGYFNFQIGLELYRFRLSAYTQLGVLYIFEPPIIGPDIVYNSESTAFDIVQTYGFSMSADLFSIDIGKRVKYDNLSRNDLIVSNIKTKRDKWDIGIRFDRRGYNDLTTQFHQQGDDFSVLKTDSVLYNVDGNFIEGKSVQLLTLGDIKRVNWGGRISGVANIYLTKRLGVRGVLGGSKLTFDVESKELKAAIIGDQNVAYSYLLENGTPQLKSAVYRKSINILDLTLGLSYKVIDQDLFSLSLTSGFGFSGMAYVALTKKGAVEGVNELDIYQEFDDFYTSTDETELKFYEGEMDFDFSTPPSKVLSKFEEPYSGYNGDKSNSIGRIYPTIHFGLDANIERYTVGLGFELSTRQMDDFVLFSSRSAYMSIAYKLFKR